MDQRSLTICDVTQAYAETSGGIKTYIERKRQYLREHTSHRHVLVVPGREDRTRIDEYSTIHEVAAPEVKGYAPYRFILRMDKVVGLLGRAAPDVVEVGSPYLTPWAAFRHRHRHPDCAVLGYYHTDFPQAYVGISMAKTPLAPIAPFAIRRAEWYARTVHRRFDATLTGSPTLRAALERMGVDNIGFVPLGVDLETFHPSQSDRSIWRQYGLDPDRPVLIFSGRIDHEKRVSVLIEALGRLTDRPDLQLALVGEGPHREALQRKAESMPGLFLLPYQSEPLALARLLASADLYVTAGPHETFGLSVVEAQACGLPMVGVRAGALIERVPPEVGRLAVVDDSEDFAAQIRAILDEDLPAIGARARAWVADRFSWSKTFENLLGIYRDSIDSRTDSARTGASSRSTVSTG